MSDEQDRISAEDVRAYGWNSIDHDNPTLTARVLAHQLYMIGMVLVDIRDRLEAMQESR